VEAGEGKEGEEERVERKVGSEGKGSGLLAPKPKPETPPMVGSE